MDAVLEFLAGLKEMPTGEIVKKATLLLAVLSLFVEITPIKINPLSALMRWISKAVNGPIYETLKEIRDTIDDNEIDRIRWEILDFANSCRNGRRHTKDEFTHIIALNEKYHDILKKRDLTNGLIDLEYSYIVELYKRCCEKNSFL